MGSNFETELARARAKHDAARRGTIAVMKARLRLEAQCLRISAETDALLARAGITGLDGSTSPDPTTPL